MLHDPGIFMVIQPGPFQPFIVHVKTERVNQMKLGTGVSAQAYDVTGVGRDFWLEQDNMEHMAMVTSYQA
jgi:hypothetical protein